MFRAATELLCFIRQRITSPRLFFFLPLTHPNIYSLSTVNWRVSPTHTQKAQWCTQSSTGQKWDSPQECECRHFVSTHTHTHRLRLWGSEGLWHVTAVHNDHRLQLLRGDEGKRGQKSNGKNQWQWAGRHLLRLYTRSKIQMKFYKRQLFSKKWTVKLSEATFPIHELLVWFNLLNELSHSSTHD